MGFEGINPVGSFNQYGKEVKLTAEQRREIGATGPETSAREIADRFGITVYYVYELRSRSRSNAKRRKKRAAPSDEELARELERDYYAYDS